VKGYAYFLRVFLCRNVAVGLVGSVCQVCVGVRGVGFSIFGELSHFGEGSYVIQAGLVVWSRKV